MQYLNDPLHTRFLCARMWSADSLVTNNLLDLLRTASPQLRKSLRSRCPVGLPRVAQPVLQRREQSRRILRDRVPRRVLNFEALDKMAKRGESRGGECGGGLLRYRDPQALEYGRLSGLRDAVVLDVGFERVQQRELGF